MHQELAQSIRLTRQSTTPIYKAVLLFHSAALTLAGIFILRDKKIRIEIYQMKRESLSYYLKRTVISALFSALFISLGGTLWAGIALGIILLAGLIVTKKRERNLANTSSPLMAMGSESSKTSRNKALTIAVSIGLPLFFLLFLAEKILGWPENISSLGFLAGVLTYFLVRNIQINRPQDS